MAKTLNGHTHSTPPPAPKLTDVHPITEEILRKQDELLNLVRGLSELARHPARELRPFNCTQEDFNKLPGLVSRSTFLYWTGMTDGELTVEVRAKHINCYKPRDNGKALYFKYEIARLTHFKL
jgi:hypothetical protein